MDKRLILSVAGSGKTSYIIDQLSLDRRALIVTYTLNNLRNLRKKTIEKFGCIPANIEIYSYFSFLYNFCYRPFFATKYPSTGITYKANPNYYAKSSNLKEYYFDGYGQIFSNRISKLIISLGGIADVKKRISTYFDVLFIDEVQDLAGNDFNFLMEISDGSTEIMTVGDFFQHTYDTSRDGIINKNLHSDLGNYKKKFLENGYVIDEVTLTNSFRCSPQICDFITNNFGIQMSSHLNNKTEIIHITSQEKADEIFYNDSIVKLFYQERAKFHCYGKNWGDTKGEDHYNDVCVVLNKTTYDFHEKGKFHELKPQSKSKLYVAISRTRGDLFLFSDSLYMKYKN